jgi:hypothetical protein
MTDVSLQSNSNWPMRVLGIAVVLILFSLMLWIGAERRAAAREYSAYARLCAMGATGDDWVSFREIVTGKPPIVQIDIPAGIPPQTAFAALPELRNLEALTLAYSTLSTEQLEAVQRLRLNSLRFQGRFPRDADVPQLAGLRSVRFLYLQATNLSVDAQTELRTLLPSTQISFE